MPAFINSPFQKPQLLQKGVPGYLIGSFSQKVGNTKLALLTDAIATNVATVTATFLNGPLPAVGDLVSIINSTNSSSAFNVTRAVLTTPAPSYNAATNVMTLTFALTGSNQSATADAGTVIVEPGETGETVSGNYTSQAILVQAPEGDSQFTLPLSVTGSSGITAMTATLQRAIKTQSNEWTNTTIVVTKTGGTTYTAGPVVEATLERAYLYRLAITSVTGSGTVIAKVG
jgi:hypothetical protein